MVQSEELRGVCREVEEELEKTENGYDRRRLLNMKKRYLQNKQQLEHSDKLLEGAIKKIEKEIEMESF